MINYIIVWWWWWFGWKEGDKKKSVAAIELDHKRQNRQKKSLENPIPSIF